MWNRNNKAAEAQPMATKPIDANYLTAIDDKIAAIESAERHLNLVKQVCTEAKNAVNPKKKFAVKCANQCDSECASDFNGKLDKLVEEIKKIPRWSATSGN